METSASSEDRQLAGVFVQSSQLCSVCNSIFRHLKECSYVELFSSGSIQNLKPETCRLCTCIRACHVIKFGNSASLQGVRFSAYSHPKRPYLDLVFTLYTDKIDYGLLQKGNTFRVVIEPEDSLAVENLAWTQHLPSQTLSDASIRFLKSKFKTCVEDHPLCKRGRQAQRYPARLLNVQRRDRAKVYLEESNTDTRGPYFTLSHCWGDLQPIKLTSETELSLRDGKYIKELPKTFQDALLFCQKFEVPYLWIDSMCIFQDNLDDWAIQAANMCDVYANAACNIAASGARNCSAGLSFERDVRAQQPFFLDRVDQGGKKLPSCIVFPPEWMALSVDMGPLNRRAWVMQERLLSKRIVHFSSTGVFWECPSDQSSDVFPQWLPSQVRSTDIVGSVHLKRRIYETIGLLSLDQTPGWDQGLYKDWECFLMAYTQCQMTVESDVFVALNGIVQEVSKVTGDQFVAGLWKGHLLTGLLWERFEFPRQNVDPPPLSAWRAPSWSWAGSNCEILTTDHWHHDECDRWHWTVSVEELDVDAHPSGKLKHAVLTLKGRLVQATLSLETEEWARRHAADICYAKQDSSRDEATFYLDRDVALDSYHQKYPYNEEVTLLAIYKCCCKVRGEPEPTHSLQALILRKCKDKQEIWERIGIVFLMGSNFEVFEDHEAEEEATIVIV